jgi:hypothetical protein
VGVKAELNVVAKRYGWRFFQKPVGLELDFLKPELTFTFFFLFFSSRVVPVEMFLNTPKHRSPDFPGRGAQLAVLRQLNSHARP